MAAQNIGIDLGLGFVKASDGKADYIFPSVVGAGQDLTFYSELTSYGEPVDNIAITVEGKKYFVGELAIRQSEILSRSLSDNHAQEKNTKIILLAVLALYCEGKSGEFNVITGLPPGFYLSSKDDLTALIHGTHRVILNTEGIDEEKAITVSKVKIIPQPMGTLFHKFFDERGAIREKDLARSKVGIIDIGFKTTDFVMVDKLEYIDRLSITKSTAMSNLYGIISDYLHRQFHMHKEDYDMEDIVRKASLKLDGELHSLAEIKKEASEELAFKILTELNSIWEKRALDAILLSGGGGAALVDYLLPELKTAVLVENSQTANVRGYLKLGQKLFGYSEKSTVAARAVSQPSPSYNYQQPETKTLPVREATPVQIVKEPTPDVKETNPVSSSIGTSPVSGSSEVSPAYGNNQTTSPYVSNEAGNARNNNEAGSLRRNTDKESFRSNLDKLFNSR